MSKIVPVILSGGVGTRLWPVSRTLFPKQLQPLLSERSMLIDTAARVRGGEFADPIIVCNDEHRFIVADQLLQAGINAQAIVLEPFGRNTAPAAAVAALMIAQADPDALMLLLPSDHLIKDQQAFEEACARAADAAQGGALMTFGIVPQGPETGFGYIQKGGDIGTPGCQLVERFVEKPDLDTAKSYVEDGGYLWNSGMFLFKASTYLDELGRLQEDILAGASQALSDSKRDMDFLRLGADAFGAIEAQSIDYAVMEHTQNAGVVPVDMGWSDVGSWSALWDVGDKDAERNVVLGDVLTQDVTGSYLRTSGPLVAAIGLSDIVLVATDDAVLVAPRDRAQQVKDIVAAIEHRGSGEHLSHNRVYRPWGWYQCMDASTNFQVKRLMIKPGGVLSLQSHRHRSEHWVVVSGTANVCRGDEEITLIENQSTYIPAGLKHRLENRADEPLYVIEVQSGTYLGEDDIERFEDVYGRG